MENGPEIEVDAGIGRKIAGFVMEGLPKRRNTLRENVRANLRRLVKRILRRHGYPPDKREKATRTVLEQAEVLSADWAM